MDSFTKSLLFTYILLIITILILFFNGLLDYYPDYYKKYVYDIYLLDQYYL